MSDGRTLDVGREVEVDGHCPVIYGDVRALPLRGLIVGKGDGVEMGVPLVDVKASSLAFLDGADLERNGASIAVESAA